MYYSKLCAKTENGHQFDVGEAVESSRGGGSGTFCAGEEKETSEVQRRSTFVDEIRANPAQKVFEPLLPKGLGKCKQKWTNPQMLTSFGRGRCEAKPEEYEEERVA